MRLNDKIVLLTGANKGLGRALTAGVAAETTHVIVNSCMDKVSPETVASEIRATAQTVNII